MPPLPAPGAKDDPEPVSELATADLEHLRVVGWRYAVLQVAGYDEPDALVIARRVDIDLHEATDLLKNGCPVTTALEILL